MRRWYGPILLVLLAGCTDPIERAGTWNAAMSGANEANLHVMVANPHDLIEGVGQDGTTGATAAPPVARLLAGKRRPLPASSASTIDVVVEPQQQGSANPGAKP